MSEAYKFYAGLNGSNVITVGDEPATFQFKKSELQSAIDACPENGVVILEPGTYTLTSFLTVYKPISIICEDPWNRASLTSALATQTVKVNVPASTAATSIKISFKNINFGNTHAAAGWNCAIDNNGGAAKPLTVNFENATFSHTGTKGLSVAQTTVGAGTELEYINFSKCSMGVVTLAHPLVGDQFNMYQCIINGLISMSAEATASVYNLVDCIYTLAVPTDGGNAAQKTNIAGPIYDAGGLGGAVTKGAAADFTDLGAVANAATAILLYA